MGVLDRLVLWGLEVEGLRLPNNEAVEKLNLSEAVPSDRNRAPP